MPTPSFEDALGVAIAAHLGQKDRADHPYILHPLRVLSNLGCHAPLNEQIVAVLHDVIEDTSITLDYFKTLGYPPVIIEALDALTHRKDELYDDYIERVAHNAIAVKVKLADLKDNMDLNRLENIEDNDLRRYKKYRRAYLRLTQNFVERRSS